jgi:hypothetical protein
MKDKTTPDFTFAVHELNKAQRDAAAAAKAAAIRKEKELSLFDVSSLTLAAHESRGCDPYNSAGTKRGNAWSHVKRR